MSSIWDLFVALKLDSTGFTKGMDGAVTKTKATSTDIGGEMLKMAAGYLSAGAAAAALGKFMKDSIDEASQAQKAQAQLNTVLASTKQAAGMSAASINEMAVSMGRLNAVDNDDIVAASNVMLTFTQIGKQVFPDAMQAALDLSQAMGQDLQGSIVQIGKALNDPITGMTALQRVGVTFSEGQKKQIKDFQDANNLMGAQKIILDELNKEFGGSSVAAANTYEGAIKRLDLSVKNLKETIGMGLLPGLTGVSKQLAVNLDMLQAGTPWWKVLEYNQRLYNMSLEDATKLTDYYYTSEKKVTEAGFLQAAMMRGSGIPANQENYVAQLNNVEALKETKTAYDLTAGAQSGLTSGVQYATRQFLDQKAAQEGLIDATKRLQDAQKTWGEQVGGDIKTALDNAHLSTKQYEAGLQAIDNATGTSFVQQKEYKDNIQAIVDNFKRTGDVSAFSTAIDTTKTAFQNLSTEVLTAQREVTNLQMRLDYLVSKAYSVNVSITSQGGTSAAVQPRGIPQGGPNSQGHAAGGSWLIDPRYGNEGYRMPDGNTASGGEKVTITPANQTTNNGGNTFNFYGFDKTTMNKIKAAYGGAYQGG